MKSKKLVGPLTPDQLSFGFPIPAKSFEDLTVTPCNETAINLVTNPESWPTTMLCLLGPPKSGLTTIAQAWTERFDGAMLSAKKLGKAKARDLEGLATGYTAIDQADRMVSNDNLVSLMNLVSAGSGRLLLTANTPPAQWSTESADLKSRLNALPIAEIDMPDEAMLVARLEAAAARNFLKLDADTLKFLLPRLDLTYEAVEEFIRHLSNAVTETGRPPRVNLAGDVLESLGWTNSGQPDLL